MKYEIILTSSLKKQLKLMKKRNKNLDKLTKVVNTLASGAFYTVMSKQF